MNSPEPILVYIIGPYTGATREDTENNVAAARAVAKHLVRKGYMPVIPQANSAFFDWDFKVGDAEFWYQGTAELMLRCDAVVCAPGYLHSSGSRTELELAAKEGMPIFGSVDSLLLTPDQFREEFPKGGDE